MAERIVSPGVFTQERDLSFLEQGVGEIAGAFIGPTPKGPAFIPTVVRSQQDFENVFGTPDGKSFLGNTVINYLRESGQATIVRVLGLSGYSNTDHTPALLYASGTSGSFLYAIIHPTISGSDITAVSASGTPSNFSLAITANTANTGTGLSTTTSANAYVGSYLGFNPTGTKGGYLYSVFPEAITAAGASVSMAATLNANALYLTGSTYGVYQPAATPWIQSQTLGGIKHNLFKVYTLTDGTSANKAFKVSIVGPAKALVSGSDYATFGLQVRSITDGTVLYEQYNLNLNPDSPQYVARVLGNSAPVTDANTGERYYQGDFPNTNDYVRVEMAEGVDNLSPDTVPFGFAAVSSPFSYGTVNAVATASVSPTFISSSWKSTSGARGYSVSSSYDTTEYYGFQYTDTPNFLNTNMSLLAPTPSGSSTVGAAFSLENLAANELYNGTTAVAVADFLNPTQNVTDFLKFDIPLQGGFDGLNPARLINMYDGITATNTQGFDLSTATADGSQAYKKAIDAIANPDSYDINLLVLPGVIHNYHPYVSEYALTTCQNRGDAFYIMDLVGPNATVTNAVQEAALIDSNYAAAYYPWVKVVDSTTNKVVFVPPSAVLPEVYAYSDNTSAEWFAPAGLNRGGIPGAAGVKVRLAQAQRDTLYEGKVNPIAQFPGQGICVWGQKTLQRRSSALDRVNVRRLLITVKKFVASSARFLVFEQNVEATRRRFLNIVNPFLANVQERSGLYAFRVIMDETNNTPDVIDRNILVGSLYLQPTKTAEFIKLDFNILPTGATFPGA